MSTVRIPAGTYTFADLRRFMDQVDGGVQILSLEGEVEFLGEGTTLILPHGLEGPRSKKRKTPEKTPFWAKCWRRKP